MRNLSNAGEGPLASRRASPSPAVTLTALPRATKLVLRGGAEAASRAGDAFGVDIPTSACRANVEGSHAALWLGPDEWLLIAPEGEGERLNAAIGAALGGIPASLVDVSHRNVAIEVAGPKAAEAINAFNALDLDPSAFPVGKCTRTLFAKAEIVLWRTRPDAFHIEVWRSFAPYVWGLLEEARLEYGAS